jgi:hypothetical protein
MLIKLVILAILAVPSIMASTREQIADALIADKDTGKLGQTFQALRKEHRDVSSSWALAEVAKQGHPGMVVTCLRTEQDHFPKDNMYVSYLVHFTLMGISYNTSDDSESFAKVITSFTPTDAKPLASIRNVTIRRSDAVNVLERVMAKSPKLITDSLPSWLASHRFDRNSRAYKYKQTARQGAYQYLASFATESVLEKALDIAKANEHYKADLGDGPKVLCCDSQDSFPQDLVDKLSVLLEIVQARNEIIRSVLQSLLPTVLVDLMLDYLRTDTI